MNLLIILAIASALSFAAGGWAGIEWHAGRDAIAAQKAEDARKTDALRQVKASDTAATSHAKALATINRRLGDAREKIAQLSGRECFDADTARMLNTIGTNDVPAPASEPSDSPGAPASSPGLRYSTDRDVAGYIALCRAKYAEVASQVNQILDFEEARQGVSK